MTEDYADRWLMWTRDGRVLNVGRLFDIEEPSTVVFSPHFLRVIADWQERHEDTFRGVPLWEMVPVEPIEDAAGTLVICNEPKRVVWRLTGEKDRGGWVGVWPD